MASAAEQLAKNLNFGTFALAKALQQRIWFTLGALLVYRLGTYIPVPGIDPDAYAATFKQAQQGIFGMFDMFAGGAVQRMAIFALNLIPYITASIVVQVITTASPRLEALRKEGESGRRKLNQYTRYLAVLIIFFAFFYTSIVFNPTDTADNLKRSGGFIPGIRPGERTATYIDYVLTRITVIGALYLTVVALIPEMIHSQLNVSQFIGGTSLLIIVTVTLDTVTQVQSHLIAQQYEGLVKRSRLGGKRK